MKKSACLIAILGLVSSSVFAAGPEATIHTAKTFKECEKIASVFIGGGIQEDNDRSECHYRFRNVITFKECVDNADSMNSKQNENDMRWDCFEIAKQRSLDAQRGVKVVKSGMTMKDCFDNADDMENLVTTEYNNSTGRYEKEHPGDGMTWACLETYPKFVSEKLCFDAADDMYFPESKDDLRETCLDKFAQTITRKSCLDQAGKMSTAAKKKDIAESCPRF